MNVKKIILTLLAVVCVLSCLTLPALAAESVPSVPAFPDEFENQGYLMYDEYPNDNSDSLKLLLYDKDTVRAEFYLDAGGSPVNLRFVYIRSVGANYTIGRYYILIDGEWVKNSSITPAIGENVGASVQNQIYAAQSDIYYSTDSIYTDFTLSEPFFPQTLLPTPLWVEVLAATEANKNLLSQTRTISILVLCGVGLMALLIGLNLLVKVFNRFQAR